MKTTRFWIWINSGPVKVTLKPGQSLHHFQSRPTDEGYHFAATELHHEGNMVRRITTSGGRDCDGVLEQTTEDFFSVDTLGLIGKYKVERLNGKKLIGPWPVWMDPRTAVYDQYAQLANY